MPRNPYENDEELDIPDFVEDKPRNDTSTSIDMSIFKMSDDELYDDDDSYDSYNDDDDYDLKPKKKKKSNMPMIISMIIIFLLLIVSIASIFYALKQHESYVKANTAYLQLQANEDAYKQQIAQKDAQIEQLTRELEAAKSSQGGDGTLVYEITDGPVSFRNKPSREADNTTYNGEDYAYNNEKFNVIEIVKGEDDPDYSWAKLKDNVYFCIGTSDEPWAKKVN